MKLIKISLLTFLFLTANIKANLSYEARTWFDRNARYLSTEVRDLLAQYADNRIRENEILSNNINDSQSFFGIFLGYSTNSFADRELRFLLRRKEAIRLQLTNYHGGIQALENLRAKAKEIAGNKFGMELAKNLMTGSRVDERNAVKRVKAKFYFECYRELISSYY